MGVWNDVKIAARLLAKDRAFTIAAVVALALGIAANTTVFTVVHSALLRDLPFEAPDRIVVIGTRNVGNTRNPNSGVSYPDLQDWSAASRSFEGLAAFSVTAMNVADERGPAERFQGAHISASAFRLIGHRPLFGRDFTPEDDRAGAEPVAILGHSIWTSRYGSDPDV
ncbi:MAG: ABC transporter permease, partial [Vicinamibacterales bacterium]